MLSRRPLSESAASQNHQAPQFLTERRWVFIDIESEGLRTYRPIIQIAAITVDSSFRELEICPAPFSRGCIRS